MPTAERWKKMTEEQRQAERERNRAYYYANPERSRDIAHRSYMKHQKERLEAAHFAYLENPEKEIKRAMRYYRKIHPEVLIVRKRLKGTKPTPSVCSYCGKSFLTRSSYLDGKQQFCSQQCFALGKGFKNLGEFCALNRKSSFGGKK